MSVSFLNQLAQLDAFPKLPSTYKSRSESRGLFTLFIAFIAFLLVLNDFGEYIWGWPDYEFSIDTMSDSFMDVNIDVVVNMPCQFLSVDLRDALGDRLFLSNGFHLDGTVFDIGQATTLKEHQKSLSARQAIAQSRNSRGLLSFFRRKQPEFRPTYNHRQDGSSCRIYGSLNVKKVTANLHITTLGHGYASSTHVEHDKMNLSHAITEFSFGPYFPDIVQPLDYSLEIANEPFVAYTYFLHVVPTTYIAPRSPPLHTNQYSVTHYTRAFAHGAGTPGIFFKFDLDPMVISIHQRTTSLIHLLIRCVGVIGGVFTCASYFLRVSIRAVEAVSGTNNTPGIVAAEATGVRKRWTGGHLRARTSTSRNSWIAEGSGGIMPLPSSSYSANYSTTPVSAAFATQQSPYPYSPYLSLQALPQQEGPGTLSVPPTPKTSVGHSFGPTTPGPPRAYGHVHAKSISGPVVGRSGSAESPRPGVGGSSLASPLVGTVPERGPLLLGGRKDD
ncbi:endoplasmic reticulum vesicle transporter-domain-containing protein [Pisolithus croceorrhizus]|nr:endoplasmic reticulum vesicle transporter-domain-containing protein [Pisolithus croceorrhizus]